MMSDMNDHRPEPVEAYRLCDLPLDTTFSYQSDPMVIYTKDRDRRETHPVYVVEWPAETIEVDVADLERVMELADDQMEDGFIASPWVNAYDRIRRLLDGES
jgi:hypothetical protein